MKTIAFVIPWFGFDIPGGAEMELKGLVSHLHDAGVKVHNMCKGIHFKLEC